ncbi:MULTISPECIES: YceH family protein [Deefgea]|uniref:YceH family protein n=1 Tax=Deefgea TaxID=400947 RepID=UPI001EF1EE30|nr:MULTISPECIES: YceH family protein [Deefgea]
MSLLQTRVLGVLIEKQHTVPDSYPLTLNSLVTGCNQKSSRDPVLEASEGDVAAAIDQLRALNMVNEVSGGRVPRYEHLLGRALQIPSQSVALLAVLMLRGPQTAGELRLNCERLHRFADISAVEGFLEELAGREPGALVAQLPKQAGARECRWAHLLSGEVPSISSELPNRTLLERVDQLELEVVQLKQQLALLCAANPQNS